MKRGFVFFFIMIAILTSILVLAKSETKTLGIDNSIMLEGKNVTLLDVNTEDDKVLLCVNDQKTIISDKKQFNEVLIEVKEVKEDYAILRIEAECKEKVCVCDGDCLNAECSITYQDNQELVEDSTTESETNANEEETAQIVEVITGSTAKEIQSEKVNKVSLVGIWLFILTIVLGLFILLFRRKHI